MLNSKERIRVAFFYRVVGDIKFISHHDMMRMFRRALARASLPVSFSQGFNPHPRISAPLPRPVGMESDAEVLIVQMSEPVDVQEVADRLAGQMPMGIEMMPARALPPNRRLQPDAARYRLTTGPPAADLLCSVERLIQSDVVPVTRFDPKGGKGRDVDVKEFLLDMQWVPDGLEYWLRVTNRGTVRPSEVAAALGFDAQSINHRICRMEVRWQ